jgi:hypothetical protein
MKARRMHRQPKRMAAEDHAVSNEQRTGAVLIEVLRDSRLSDITIERVKMAAHVRIVEL